MREPEPQHPSIGRSPGGIGNGDLRESYVVTKGGANLFKSSNSSHRGIVLFFPCQHRLGSIVEDIRFHIGDIFIGGYLQKVFKA